jgi:hypothetical protein
MKSKEEVRDLLGLAALPDDEFMDLLRAAGAEETVTGVPPIEDEGYTPEELRAEFREALVARTVGDLLSHARDQSGASLRQVGQMVGLSHSRIQQLEASENLEVATLVRVAAGLGFRVKISLEPDRDHASFKRVEAELSDA